MDNEPRSNTDISGITLGESESVLVDVRPSWTNYTRRLALGVFVFPLYSAWRDRKTTRYIVTSERLVIKDGSLIGSMTTDEYELANVERIETEQSVLERTFGSGSVTVHMRHEHHEAEQFDVTLPSIPDHDKVAQTLREQCR